jgi:NADPH:quinone reductase-like Zn-dependent oxidoreductase
MEIPPALSWTEAACIPITFVVAHDALITNGQMITGTDVLVNAASSGIGVAAIQIGRFLGAGEVIGSSRSADKQDALRKLGASAVVDAASPTFVEEVRAATHGDGVQVVVDSIGGPTLPVNMEAMRLEGRLVSVGRMGGTSSACDLDLLALKRLRLIGVTNRTRTLGQQAECVRRFLNDAGGGLSSRALTPHIDREFPWTQALAAQDYLASGRHVGKVVLRVKE